MFNITRPREVPLSLTSSSPKYNAPDVLKALNAMSHSKCYICESQNPTAIAVEHFDANGDRYDWSNLLLACHRCNSNLKGKRFNQLLNPCDPVIDVVRAIRHDIPKGPDSNIRIEKSLNLHGCDETVELLDNVFNLNDTGNRAITRGFLRKRIFDISCKFLKEIYTYCDADSRPEIQQNAKDQIVHFLRPEQEYSAFLRWVILDDERLKHEFEQFIL